MAMSLHKLTAGSGYTYLTRQVAAHDRAGGPRTSLASYYADEGETPGRWVGSGVTGIDDLAVGDEVTAEQMRLLFGFGLHPLADQREEQLQGPGLRRCQGFGAHDQGGGAALADQRGPVLA